MEPITMAIVAALSAGAAAGATQVGKEALVDAYTGLKSLLQRKFGKTAQAVAVLEAKPDSKGRQLTLQEEVEAAQAGQDPEVVQAAKVLAAAVQRYVEQMKATGVELTEVEALSLEINKVFASGTGVKAEKVKIAGDIKISEVQAGLGPNA